MAAITCRCLLYCLVLLGCGSQAARAQESGNPPATFDFKDNALPVMSLDGKWRFHTGDDPDGQLHWADPQFDDSSWPLLLADRGWGEQGYKGYTGLAWYRFKVVLPSDHKPWAICVPRLLTSYQIFADGKPIGQFGGMPPHGQYFVGYDQLFQLPDSVVSAGGERHTVSIAIRVWQWPRFPRGVSGGPLAVSHVGHRDALTKLQTYESWGRFWSSGAGNVLMMMNLLAAFFGLFLFAMRPRDREYLWFGLYELFTGADHLLLDYFRFHSAPESRIWLADVTLSAASWLLFLLFIGTLFKARRNWLFWAAVATEIVTIVAQTCFMMGWLSLLQFDLIWAVALLPYFSFILVLLFRNAKRGVPDARLLLVPVTVCYLCWLARILLGGLANSGHLVSFTELRWFFEISTRPFPFSVNDLADMLMLVAVVAVLPLRFARSRRDEERFAQELESARAVQQVLVPNEIPQIPGFQIRCIYKPAGQVGGDFFQVVPLAGGGALIAIGDVSGKGIPAAMTVSLLVGTFQALAASTQKPAELLSAMNRCMLLRSHGGFTTCAILRVHPQGTATVANAGHLAPYLAGKELNIENGLPLGVSSDTDYPETQVLLPEGAQLTLYTDGVVEARAASGELLGFERTAALSMQSAESIVEAARTFGQDDDITVLTIVLRQA